MQQQKRKYFPHFSKIFTMRPLFRRIGCLPTGLTLQIKQTINKEIK